MVSLQQIDHEGLIHAVSSEQLMLLLELCEAFIWAAISEAGNTNELILCSRGNSGSFKSNNYQLFVTYTWLADVNASVAKCLCF